MFKNVMILLCGAALGAIICTYSNSARHGVTSAADATSEQIHSATAVHK